MNDMVNVTIAVDPLVAEALAHPANLLAASAMISRAFRPRIDVAALSDAIAALKKEAREAGLTDADIDFELAAHKAERRRQA